MQLNEKKVTKEKDTGNCLNVAQKMKDTYQYQGHREVTSSVAFEVLIINCKIDFINLFILNCFTSVFCFLENIFPSRGEWLFVDVHP